MQLIRAMQEAIAEQQKPVVVFAGEMVFAAKKCTAYTAGNAVVIGRLPEIPGFCGLLAWVCLWIGLAVVVVVVYFGGVV